MSKPKSKSRKSAASPNSKIAADTHPSFSPPPHATYGKYRQSRFYAVWINDQLLVVTVYKKGALAVLAYLGLDKTAVEIKPPPPVPFEHKDLL